MKLKLTIFKDIVVIEHQKQLLLPVEDIFKKLEGYRKQSEKPLRRDNFLSSSQYVNVVLTDSKYTSLSSVIKFCYNNAIKHSGCAKVCTDIEKSLVTNNQDEKTVLSLYKQVAEFDFGKTVNLWKAYDQVVLPSDASILTLYGEYKCHFNPIEWRKICLFEWHFTQQHGSDLSYEISLAKKYSYFQRLLDTHGLSKHLSELNNQTIQRRKVRKELSSHNEIVLTFDNDAEHKHCPAKIELELIQTVKQVVEDFHGQIHVVNCKNICGKTDHGAHVFVECNVLSNEDSRDSSFLVESYLRQKHSLPVASITFFNLGTFPEGAHRFEVQDLISLMKDQKDVFFQWASDQVQGMGDYTTCDSCFRSESVKKPLHWSTFNVEEEWLLDTPLEQQILLESYFNNSTISRTENITAYMRTKLVRLYATVDSLLNVTNKKHFGVIQELNTSELMINYHNLTDVFRMTQQMGLTQGMNAAENKWKGRATEELNYYNHAIKKYPLLYETEAGQGMYSVSLRDCFIFAMRDNLVTLTEKHNPQPGESRTGQIDTIQGTDLGVPRNSKIFSDIHAANGCDATDEHCPCREAIPLTKNDLADVLLVCTSDEDCEYRRLNQLCSWGLSKVWPALLQDDFICAVLCSDEPEGQETHIPGPNLEESFSKLEILGDALSDEQLLPDKTSDDMDLVELHHALEGISFPSLSHISTIPNTLNLHDSDFEDSFDPAENMSHGLDGVQLLDNDIEDDEDQSASIGFHRYITPPFHLFRTAPWIGRDDDPKIVETILNDLIIQADIRESDHCVLGVDQKIGAVHMKLAKAQPHFRKIIREIPPLHLLKMKILNFCSGYKDAGVLHIIKYMKDTDKDEELTKLLMLNNIRSAARLIQRLAISLCLALQVLFLKSLPDEEGKDLLSDLGSGDVEDLARKWDEKYRIFLGIQSAKNATFKMHVDIMCHAVETVGINLAERIGGTQGYALLRACMKRSLLYSFLNGASSYAAYSVRLLADHSSSPRLVQGLKERFFSVPYNDSCVNMGLDTVREEEHRHAKKFFRPRSTSSIVGKRMHRMEEANEMSNKREQCLFPEKSTEFEAKETNNWKITSTDIKFILRGTSLILRRLNADIEQDLPYNVYTPSPTPLSLSMIDSEGEQCGEYLLYKYCKQEKLFAITADDVDQKKNSLEGPKELMTKVLAGTSTTVKRNTCKVPKNLSAVAKEVDVRRKKVEQEKKRVEGLFSSQNACQAIVSPACTKYKVMKSVTVPKAIVSLVGLAVQACDEHWDIEYLGEKLMAISGKDLPKVSAICQSNHLILEKQRHLEDSVSSRIKVVTVENAGILYKSGKTVAKGVEFIREFQDRWLTETLALAPKTEVIIISEEKYDFTPDTLKAATRLQRKSSTSSSIAHLKTSEEMISEDRFARTSITSTLEGKQTASTFIARNAHKLTFNRCISVVFDSELHIAKCQCPRETNCKCVSFTTPMKCSYDATGLQERVLMKSIRQRKGEAECAQIDWVLDSAKNLKKGEAILSIVTSADIDSVVLHLFAISDKLPREPNGSFSIDVFVILRKACVFDVYNVTGIVQLLETAFDSTSVCKSVAMALAMGGNDFLPKFQNVTHLKFLQVFLGRSAFHNDIFTWSERQSEINESLVCDLVKELFCPSSMQADKLTYEEVRQLSIKPPKKTNRSKDVVSFSFVDGQADLKHPKKWLPPKTCVLKLCTLYKAMAEYFTSLGIHDADLPNFNSTCLSSRDGSGMDYDLGPDSHVSTLSALLPIEEKTLQEQKQKAMSKKRNLQSTRQKDDCRKRPNISLTPLKYN